jgi:hypothetical protein
MALTRTWPKMSAQKFLDGTWAELSVDYMAVDCDYDLVAQRHPDITALQVICNAAFPNTWRSLVVLLPRLKSLHIVTPWAANVAELQSIAPRITSLSLLAHSSSGALHDVMRNVLRDAHALSSVIMEDKDFIALEHALPSTLLTMNVQRSWPGIWPYPLQLALQDALTRFLMRSKPLQLSVGGFTFPLQFLECVVRHCTCAYIYSCEDERDAQTIVKDMVRDRPAERRTPFVTDVLYFMTCNSVNPKEIQWAHFQRVDALAAHALPVAHLPELVAVFLL